jgi:hypothetical protein
MLLKLLQVVFFISLSFLVSGQDYFSDSIVNINDKLYIINQLEQQRLAWNEGNLEKYMEAYLQSDSLMFITRRGITRGWKQTLAQYRKSYPDKTSMGKLEFSEINIIYLSENKILMLGKWQLEFVSKVSSGGYFSLYWVKTDSGWRIAIDHTS